MKNRSIRYYIVFVLMGAGTVWGVAGCKKFPDPGMNIQEYRPAVDSSLTRMAKRKVLLISVDGLNAPAVSTLKPANITALLQHAKYTFDYSKSWQQPWPINNTASWASMLTGEANTRMWDSSFYAVPVDSVNSIPVPPNITVLQTMIERSKLSNRIVAVTPWSNLLYNFMTYAGKKVRTAEDGQTRTETVNALKTDSANLFITQFTGVQEAGAGAGYGNNETAVYPDAYKTAINTVDGYIGELMSAIRSRPAYAKENWLTIITTNQVSYKLLYKDSITAAAPLINWFIVAHNDYFTPAEITTIKPAIYPRIEEVATNILFWLKIPVPASMTTKNAWLSVFETEYGDK